MQKFTNTLFAAFDGHGSDLQFTVFLQSWIDEPKARSPNIKVFHLRVLKYVVRGQSKFLCQSILGPDVDHHVLYRR